MKTRLFALLFLILVPVAGFAQGPSVPAGRPFSVDDIINIADSLADFLFTIGIVFVAIMLIWSGILYVTAGSDTTKVGSAKGIFKSALIGGLIIFGVSTILATLNAIATRGPDFFNF